MEKRLVYVYSLYKELEGDEMKFEWTNDTNSFVIYTIKLVDDSAFLIKTLNVSDSFLNNLTKEYDSINMIFMQYGNEWTIYKLNTTKKYFENIVRDNKNYPSFHKLIYDEILYPSSPTGPMVPAFFHNRSSLQEVISGQISRKYQILINFN